ncbi:MAG: hypothetical protein KDA80_02295 [Planctomycetaceae bacterium]|nr:hypothetical protein [Planctomycetaceae bacterium]
MVHQEPQASWGDVLLLRPGLVAIADWRAEQVVLFAAQASGWSPVERLEAPGQAHSLSWHHGSQTLYASGRWSQQLYRWQLAAGDAGQTERWRELPRIDLRMCGGEMLLLPQRGLLLVADAFGRNYRLLRLETGEVLKSDKVYGHNISSLATDKDEELVLFPHQLLNEHAHSERNDITWGGLLSNNLRWLKIDRLLQQSGQEIFKQGRFYPLGQTGNGSGDPTCLQVSSQGLMAITLGGTNRVAVGSEDDYYFRQIEVGYHPVACRFSPDERQLLVVNQFSDSLSIIDLSDDSVQHLPLGALREPTQVERGEQAFFDARLAHDGWMSCHSCHPQGHTNGQLNDNMTDGSFGTPKRVLSLLGLSETRPYSWRGSMANLEQQVTHSIASTMASDHPVSSQTVEDLVAFLRQLEPPPSLLAARLPRAQRRQGRQGASTAAFAAGEQLFEELSCSDCHAGAWRTHSETFDVGLRDERQTGLFNPPSLIGVSQRQDALFHDGRASSLRSVLETYHHQLPRELGEQELSQLVAYLEGL